MQSSIEAANQLKFARLVDILTATYNQTPFKVDLVAL
jgi:hypothetical protein